MGKGKFLSDEERYTKHHILPQHPFWTNLEWSSHPHNIITIRKTTHQAQHALYDNLMLANQLLTCVELSWKALLPEVKDWLVDTLTNTLDPYDPRQRYKPECIK